MKKIYSVFLLLSFVSLINSPNASAQCPTPGGMMAVPVTLNGFCFVNIQFAIPNSNVSIYNATGGPVGIGTANASGQVVIPYPCSANPLTSILSINPSTGAFCTLSNILQVIPLPVKLVSFSGTLNDSKKVTLSWKTAYELNSEKIDIEKSIDGINFYLINTIKTDETSLSEKNYAQEDASFTPGTTAFYRLKQTDLDGKISYSKVVYINDKSFSEISLFPNPTQKSSSIILKGVAAKDVQYSNIQIFSLGGKNIAYKITGANSIELHSSATAGIYVVRIKEKSLKLIVE